MRHKESAKGLIMSLLLEVSGLVAALMFLALAFAEMLAKDYQGAAIFLIAAVVFQKESKGDRAARRRRSLLGELRGYLTDARRFGNVVREGVYQTLVELEKEG